MPHSSPSQKSMTVAACAFMIACLVPPGAVAARAAARQAPPVASEKEARTPAQRKINSQILYEIYRRRGDARRKGVPPAPTGVDVDGRGRALVDVRAEVTPALQKSIRSIGGVILSSSAEHRSIIARVPLLELERLAGESTVRFIEPAAKATTNVIK
jgi:hypothetical protein